MPTTPPAGAEPDSAPLPAELVARLQVWRAVHTAQFLAGVGIDDARVRPAELAATIVDRHGRRLARVLRGPLFAGPLEVKAGPDAAAQWHTVSRLDLSAVATRLGDPALRPQPSGNAGGCAYVVENEDGSWASSGTVKFTYFTNAAVAWVGWRYNETEGNPRDVPNLGRSARLISQARNVEGKGACSVYLDVLDSNLRLSTGVGADADLPSRPCDDLEALSDALIESTRASLARLAENP